MIADRAVLGAARARSDMVARAWRESAPHRALERSFAGLDAAAIDELAEVAQGLLADIGWIGPLLAPLIDALAADPWHEPPFRVSRDPLRIGAILFSAPAATLTATILSADAIRALPPPRTIAFSGRLAVTRYVRGGGATLARWAAPPLTTDPDARAAPHAVRQRDLPLVDGMVVRLDGRTSGHLIERPASDIVTLSFALRDDGNGYAREYARSDGTLVRAATLADATSRTQMLLTLLRLARRADAGGCFAAATRDASFHLRWGAMREWLALDALAALPRLAEMAADDPNREIRAAAAATIAQVEAQRRVPCPA